MTTTSPFRLTAVLSLSLLAAMVVGAGSSTLAAKGDKKDDRKDADKAASDAAPALIESIKGNKMKMAKAKVANRVTRIRDAASDQTDGDGVTVPGAPAWSDMAAVSVAPIKVPSKLLAKMADDFPRGAVGAFYGKDAPLAKGQRAVFVAVELAGKRPAGTAIQQVEVGLDGDAAGPVQVGSARDTRAGVERFSLSGRFANGSESSGTTNIGGRRPGDEIDYYNADSRVFGFYDARRTTYFLVMPTAPDARSVAVTLRSSTEAGEVLDRLELPDGGYLIPLADPSGGFKAGDGATQIACRALETFSAGSGAADLADPGATLIRYTVGLDPGLPVADAEAAFAALDDLGRVPLTLKAVPGESDGSPIDAEISLAPALRTVSLTMEVPPGQWHFEVADDLEILTPAGEALIDHSTLTGRAGLLTGEGLDGFVSGDPLCGRWDLGADACELIPAEGLAALVGLTGDDVEQMSLVRADGAQWCVGAVPATGEPQYVARFGTGYQAVGGLEVADFDCPAQPVDLGAGGYNVDCGEAGYENHSFVVVPDATVADDPEGGLLVSVDMLVDRGKALGERYDGEAARAVFGGIAATLARSARPAGLIEVDDPVAEEAAAAEEDAAAEPAGNDA